MSNQKNRPYPRVQEEKTVIDDAHAGARRGSLIGALTGGGVGSALAKRRKLYVGAVGALAGGAVGHETGRRIGAAAGARDVRDARRALRQNNSLSDARDFDRLGNSMEPDAFPQQTIPMRKSVRGARSEPGNGVSAEAAFFRLREKLTARFGLGITSALEDSELSEENCQALRDAIMAKIAKTDSPSAGVRRGEDFERATLAAHLGAKVVEAMSPAEIHCHFLSAERRGLISLEDQSDVTNFAILNRERTAEGTFAPNDATDPGAVARAYSPRRRTGKATDTVGAVGAAAGIAGAIAHLRGRKGRRARLPLGVPKLDNAIDAESTNFAMRGGPGAYPIKRRALRGKKPPGVPKLIRKPKHFGAFLIDDPDFPLVPQKPQKLPVGTLRRVAPARTRAQVIRRLKGMTQLSRREFGAGSLASGLVEGAIDAVGLGGATSPKKKKLMIDTNGNVVNPAFLPTPDTRLESSFASAIARLHEFGLAGRLAAEGGVIAGADLTAEELHDAIQHARERKRKKALVKSGVEQESGVQGNGPTALSSIRETLNEFDSDGARDRARKRTPVSRQLRKVVGGAALGAVTAKTIDRFIQGGRKDSNAHR